MRLALAVVATLTLANAAHAGNAGIVIPPVEVDLGVGVPVGQLDEMLPSTEILAGLHWASLAWRPTRFDAGFGYVGSFRAVPADHSSIIMHGGYLSLGTTLVSHKHWRTWFVARGELLRVSDGKRDMSALGSSLRIATELFGSGASGGSKGFLVGTVALGVYLEATYRDVPKELGPFGVTSGVTCRLPFAVAGG